MNKILRKVRNRIRLFVLKPLIHAQVGDNTIFGYGSFCDKQSSIGCEGYFGSNCTITKTIIGNYASVGNDVVIGPGEHDLKEYSISGRVAESASYITLTNKECVIGNDVWIGTRAIILRGVVIGDGAVIGAGSIVTKSVPDYAIVAGVPAKVLGYRLDEETRNKLIMSKWWHFNREEAKNILNDLRKER